MAWNSTLAPTLLGHLGNRFSYFSPRDLWRMPEVLQCCQGASGVQASPQRNNTALWTHRQNESEFGSGFFLWVAHRLQRGWILEPFFKQITSQQVEFKRNGTQERSAVIHVINLTVISKYSAGFSPCDKWISPYWSLNLKKKSRVSCNARIRLHKYIQILTWFGRS